MLNTQYRGIAEKLTDLENHRLARRAGKRRPLPLSRSPARGGKAWHLHRRGAVPPPCDSHNPTLLARVGSAHRPPSLEEEYENSLVLKRFFFEAFDCYIALFYVGFVQQDIRKLRRELIALYTADSIRRVVTETLLPQLTGGAGCG
eukprot:gene5344-759_t